MSSFTTPILFITFNRPEHTRRVLSVIKDKHPKCLFIFQDGPRNKNSNDKDNCNKVRVVIEELVTWDCELHTLFSDQNHGCGPGPAKAISWFFENVEQGIILEDDTIPHLDFFDFAALMLDKYAPNEKVMAIGSMKLGEKRYGDGSYYFSKMNHTLCAWATWRRAWNLYDYRLSGFSRGDLNRSLKEYGARLRERDYWCERLAEIHKDALNDSSWDQQFWMTIWRSGGKGILPNVNLASNIGFGEEATHTKDASNPLANNKIESVFPIVYPTSEVIQKKADFYFQRNYFQPWEYGWSGFKRLPFRLNKRLKRWIGHEGPWFK